MPQRFTLDRPSFEQFLSAASFLQQFERQALQRGSGALHSSETLLGLVELQNSLEAGCVDLDSTIHRVVELTPKVVGADGAALWLFRENELAYVAGTPGTYNSEGLRLRVLSRLVHECHLATPPELAELAKVDSGDYPGSLKSLLVAPVRNGSKVAGALTAVSAELGNTTDRDMANLGLLAKLLSRGLERAVEEGLRRTESLERTTLLRVLDNVGPVLRELVGREEPTFWHEKETLAEQAPDVPAEPFRPIPDVQVSAVEPRRDRHVNLAPDEVAWLEDGDGSDALASAHVPAVVPHPPSAPVTVRRSPFKRLRAAAHLRMEKVLALCLTWRQGLRQGRERYAELVAQTYDGAARGGRRAVRQVRNASAQILRQGQRIRQSRGKTHDALQEEIRGVRAALARASLAVGRKARATSRYRIRVRLSGPKPGVLRVLSKSAGAWLMLAIIGGFLALLGSHKDVQTAAASSEVSRQARVRTEDASVPERQLASVDTSHGRVTDKATEAALNQLTRFELPSLRRQAEFGDDTAAFELGMSYEVGRGVPQNCAQAAQWVLQAAEGSKAAAEYNLGLRYRDGDGVPADPGAAAKWLRKASAHKYAGADIALSGLSTPGAIGGQP